MKPKPSEVFNLDYISYSENTDINVYYLEIIGFYYDPSSNTEPEIRVCADNIEIGILCFYIERPDLEAAFGKLAYAPGFNEKISVNQGIQQLKFIDSKSNRILMNRMLPAMNSGHEGEYVNLLQEAYQKISLELSLNKQYGICNRASYFKRFLVSWAGNVKRWASHFPCFNNMEKLSFKILFFSHNFNYEGAPKILYSIALGLMEKPGYEVTIVSQYDGPAKAFLRTRGIKVIVTTDQSAYLAKDANNQHEEIQNCKQEIYQIILAEKPDLIFVNVLFNYHIVNIAGLLKIPVVWKIHESFTMENLQKLIPNFEPENYINAFMQATFVIFCTTSYRKYYNKFNFRKNFMVIHNGLDPYYEALKKNEEKRIDSRKKLNIRPDEIMVLNVGIVVQHKNQELLVYASELLKHKKIRFFIVGEREEIPYAKKVRALVKKKNLDEKVTVVSETPDTDLYYAAADIFVFTSTNDTYPLAILEAMAYGLPIITTPINGVNEQVQFGINAFKADYSDPITLSAQILQLSDNENLRVKMGKKSRKIFKKLETFDAMFEAHEKVFRKALQTYNPLPYV